MEEQKKEVGPLIDPRAEIIPPELEEELEKAGIDTKDPAVSRTISVMLSRSYYGPMMLPPAFVLEEYKREFPEIVPKLIEWTERQIAHRHNDENLARDRSENRLDRAQIGALAVAVSGLCLAAAVGTFGNAVVASIIAIVSVGGPVAATALATKFGTRNNDGAGGDQQ
jgi:uncharacterized membrane protein